MKSLSSTDQIILDSDKNQWARAGRGALVQTTAVQLKPFPTILGIQLCARAVGNRQPVLTLEARSV